MPSNGLFFIATNLIILAHVHSFVLLTASFDDVKKLAQKFVSESIADTIADFVVKASNNINKRISKEIVPKSRDNLESESVSDEDKDTNITKESISKENIKYKPKTQKTKIHKTRFESKFLNSSEIKTKKKKEKLKKMEDNKFNIGNIKKQVNFNDISENSAYNNVSVESTAGYQDEKVSDKDLISDQDEEPVSDYDFRFKKETKEKRVKIDGPATLTTRKKKTEFDQYDNPKYPKAVATSGSVTLQRLLGSQKSRYREQNLSEKNESS